MNRSTIMSDAAQEQLPELLALWEGDREFLVATLSESLTNADNDAEFIATPNRSWEEIKSGKENGIPGDEVLAEARNRH